MLFLRRILSVLLLTTVAGLRFAAPTQAASPQLRLACTTPSPANIVACVLDGSRFHALERLRVTYSVTFTALPRVKGRFPSQTFRRAGFTGPRGNFLRPPLRFGVVRYHESFRLTATAVGATGDHATINYVAIVN